MTRSLHVPEGMHLRMERPEADDPGNQGSRGFDDSGCTGVTKKGRSQRRRRPWRQRLTFPAVPRHRAGACTSRAVPPAVRFKSIFEGWPQVDGICESK